jgi:hypothetical protein
MQHPASGHDTAKSAVTFREIRSRVLERHDIDVEAAKLAGLFKESVDCS